MQETICDECAILLLGSNLGNRMENLNRATELITASDNLKILKKSSIYETDAWGNTDQPKFLNQVLILSDVKMRPQLLLKTLLGIEKELGRIRAEKWGARKMDIDILFFGTQIISTELLKIPHPQIHNRKFTLLPLNELIPDFKHPVLNVKMKDLLERCSDTLSVQLI